MDINGYFNMELIFEKIAVYSIVAILCLVVVGLYLWKATDANQKLQKKK